MERLTRAAERLNKASDELNEVLDSFDDQLQQAGVGITYWLGHNGGDPLYSLLGDRSPRTGQDENEVVTEGWMLGYAKVDKQWRVAVRQAMYIRFVENSEDSPGWKFDSPAIALRDAPRAIRVEAAPLLEELANELVAVMEQYAGGVEAAKKLVAPEPRLGALVDVGKYLGAIGNGTEDLGLAAHIGRPGLPMDGIKAEFGPKKDRK